MARPISPALGPDPCVVPTGARLSWDVGCETLVDAEGCDSASLQSEDRVRCLVEEVIVDLSLKPLGSPLWHMFPAPGGMTGLVLLTESHLTLHTFPELRVATFNLYCCRPRPAWPWEDRLRNQLGAQFVRVRTVRRGESRDD